MSRSREPEAGFTSPSIPFAGVLAFGLYALTGSITMVALTAPALLALAIRIVSPDPYWLPSRPPLLLYGAAARRARRAREDTMMMAAVEPHVAVAR